MEGGWQRGFRLTVASSRSDRALFKTFALGFALLHSLRKSDKKTPHIYVYILCYLWTRLPVSLLVNGLSRSPTGHLYDVSTLDPDFSADEFDEEAQPAPTRLHSCLSIDAHWLDLP